MHSFTMNTDTSDGHEMMAAKIFLKVISGGGPIRIIVASAQLECIRACQLSVAAYVSPQHQEHRFESLFDYLYPYIHAALRDQWKLMLCAVSLKLVNGRLTVKHALTHAAAQAVGCTAVACLLIAH